MNFRAAGSWVTQSVSWRMMSDWFDSDSSVAPTSWLIWLRPGLSRTNSGSCMIESGLPSMPGWPRPRSDPR